MSIDIKYKIHSLLRRKQQFCCISYNWHKRQIQVHQNQNDYLDDLKSLKQLGMTKRMECYVQQPLFVDENQQYFVYLVSLGDFRKWKMVNGENPIAKGFGLCLFDYVYVFLQHKDLAKKKMEGRILELEGRGDWDRWQAKLMKNMYGKYFGYCDQSSQYFGKESDFETI